MRRHKTPLLLGVLIVAIGLGFPQAGQGEEGRAGAVAAAPEQPLEPIPDARNSLPNEAPAAMTPDALSGPAQAPAPQDVGPPVPRPIVVPARPLAAVSVAVGAAYGPVPHRAYRRAPIPAYAGIYVAPRYVYPGYFAPWGSLPLSYYAASIPLPFRVVQPAGYMERMDAAAARAYRPGDLMPGEGDPPLTHPSRPQSSGLPILSPPEPGPEPIPVPVPMDSPASSSPTRSGSGQPGGVEAKVPTVAAEKPAPRATPSGPSGEGPREF
jgi:hypothetical protein